MVSGLSIAFMAVTLLLSVGLPVGLVIFFYRKYKISFAAVSIGALMFFVSQMLIRLPLLAFIGSQSWYHVFSSQNIVLAGILIAFSAALFETAGRYLGMKLLLKNKLEWKNGIAYGIGHGGIEAILLVGLTYVGFIAYSIMINTGNTGSELMPQILTASPLMFLAAGLERVFAITFHIAAALLVAYGILSGKKVYILYCLLFHTLLDGGLTVLRAYGFSDMAIELWVAAIGIFSLVMIIKSGKAFQRLIPNNTGIVLENHKEGLL